jgi:ferredoxin-NADP reductase
LAGAEIQRRLNWLIVEVVAVVEETSRARSLTLRCPGWVGHRPGQHVDLRLTAPDGYQVQRSYSIATPVQGDLVGITVERVPDGEVSPFLIDVVIPGDMIEVRGPIGGYFVWEPGDGRPVFLVGGGSGVIPLMAMVRSHVASRSSEPMHLLVSARTHESVIYRHELERMQSDTTLGVTITLTRAQPDGWAGFSRRVDEAMLREVSFPPDSDGLSFVCGPTGFVESVASMMVGLGHAPETIKTERFGPTGG